MVVVAISEINTWKSPKHFEAGEVRIHLEYRPASGDAASCRRPVKFVSCQGKPMSSGVIAIVRRAVGWSTIKPIGCAICGNFEDRLSISVVKKIPSGGPVKCTARYRQAVIAP